VVAFQSRIDEEGLRKPWNRVEDPEITMEDKTFIGKMMMFDPRDRWTAGQLLEDSWLRSD
jgi:hypothetical protein